jgi:GNAT superfamily N-acetyltransferase
VLPDLFETAASAATKLPPGVSLHAMALEPFAQRIGALRGSPLAQRQAHAERLLASPVPFFASELRQAGESLVCGQFAIEGDLVGLYDIFTDPAARGRGLAGVLCRHLLDQAHVQGARDAYLQVDAGNAAARKVYQTMGFVDRYAYHYREFDRV